MADAAQGGGTRPRRGWLWAQGLGCGLVVASAAPLALVLSVVFGPAVLAAMSGPMSGAEGVSRRRAGVLLVYGLAAALPWLDALWGAARNWAVALDLLAGLRLVGWCWGAQAAAWLMIEVTPLVARLVLEARVRARQSRLRGARSRLQEEWGLER